MQVEWKASCVESDDNTSSEGRTELEAQDERGKMDAITIRPCLTDG